MFDTIARTRHRSLSLLARALVVPLVAGGCVALGAHAASATTYSVVGTGSDGLNKHATPSTAGAFVGRLANGATISIICQTAGGSYATGGSPATDTIWDEIAPNVYVADWWTNTPAVGTFSTGIPRCSTATPPPPPPAPTYTEVRNRQSARCLDADLATINSDGTKVQLWDCWGGANEQWLFASDGTIRNQQSGRCLDADEGTINADGTIVHLYHCNGSANQRWSIDGNGVLHSARSARVLDADGPTINGNGTKIQLWDANAGRNQQFYKATQSSWHVTNSSYCPAESPYHWPTAIHFSPCINVTDAYDGTTAAPRSVQASGCPKTAAWYGETLGCDVESTKTWWNGSAVVDQVTVNAYWAEEIVTSLIENVYVNTSYENDKFVLTITTAPNGGRSSSVTEQQTYYKNICC
jgi:Ricin-type beta-trefoil lectin domain